MLFSTFLMWLLADLFEDLPEAGDLDKPKLVFFLDEAHLLFKDASKAFLAAITTTVRLIRSKGVGIFFVTQTPKDVPGDVLGQLANRIQHALRAFTPDDAKALKATVSTFPISDYDLEEILTSAGIGEAVITVMNERGAPTPVALTRLRAPESVMGPSDDALIARAVAASTLLPVYGTAVDNESAFEKLSRKTAGSARTGGGPAAAGNLGGTAGAQMTPALTMLMPRPGGSRKRFWAGPAAGLPGPIVRPHFAGRTGPSSVAATPAARAAPARLRRRSGRPRRRLRRRSQEHGPLARHPTRAGVAPRRLRHLVQARRRR